jgi:hypothetical protein
MPDARTRSPRALEKLRPLATPEVVLGTTVTLIATVLLAVTNATFFYSKQMDATYAVEALDSVRRHGVLLTELVNSFLTALRTTFVEPAQSVCSSALDLPDPLVLNGFDRHSYLVLYLLAPLSAVVPTAALIAVLISAAFTLAAASVYLFLRVEGCGRWQSLGFLALLLTAPAWYASATGQYYFDRLFVFVGLAFTLLVYARLRGRTVPTPLILATGVAGCLINERGALGISLVALAVTFGCRRVAREQGVWLHLLVLGVAAAVFALAYLKLFAHNEDYGSLTSSVRSFLPSLTSDPAFARNTAKFVLFNAAFLLLALRAWWPFAAAAWLGCVPNVVATIAGAEKTGWSTHYHSYYFPVLVAAAAIGYSRLCRPGSGSRFQPALATGMPALTVCLSLCAMFLYPFASDRLLDWRTTTWQSHAGADVLARFTNYAGGASRRAQAQANLGLRALVPDDVLVTTTEASMPALYGHGRDLQYYPLGLAQAQFAVLPYTQAPDGSYVYTGAVSYLGPQVAADLNSCLNARLRDAGYDVEKPVGTSGGVAVLRRR